jgi:hypothetical protein
MPFTETSAGVYGGAGTSINGKGYVIGGAGYIANNQQGIWSYDPATNSWKARTFSPFAAFDGEYHFAFVINDIIYSGSNLDPNFYNGRIWSYDPSKDPTTP